MSRHTILFVSGVTLHYPQRYAVVSADRTQGELCRTQTSEKAERLQRALNLLERYERGELVERDGLAAD